MGGAGLLPRKWPIPPTSWKVWEPRLHLPPVHTHIRRTYALQCILVQRSVMLLSSTDQLCAAFSRCGLQRTVRATIECSRYCRSYYRMKKLLQELLSNVPSQMPPIFCGWHPWLPPSVAICGRAPIISDNIPLDFCANSQALSLGNTRLLIIPTCVGFLTAYWGSSEDTHERRLQDILTIGFRDSQHKNVYRLN